MKIMKIAFLLLLVLAVVCFTGWQKNKTEQWSPGKPLDKSKITIGIVYLDDASGGWSSAHELGLRETARKFGLRDDQIIRKFNVTEDTGMAEHVIEEAISKGANIIIATSWGFMDACEQMAAKYPNVIFAHASGYKRNDTNFTNYFGRIYQARYLAGIAAGLNTKTGKIGFVAAQGSSNSEVTGGLNAFAMGVESVKPEAQVYVSITYSWFDPASERKAAQRLISAGCDVIAQHCDTAEPQIAAEQAGVRGIGYNIDMSKQAPNAVLTSIIWKWDVYYNFLISSIIDGSFTTKPYFGGLVDGIVDIVPPNRGLSTPGTAEAVAEAKERIVNGSFNVFNGVIETNDGRTIGTEGGTLSDSEIVSGINWYYRNVIVLP